MVYFKIPGLTFTQKEKQTHNHPQPSINYHQITDVLIYLISIPLQPANLPGILIKDQPF